MRRVLHLRMVSQCAMLEDFGIFLVLADKVRTGWFLSTRIALTFSQSLFAYHIEALVPSSPGAANSSQTPQKLSGNKDVQFFTVGNLSGRTLVIYMKKKNVRDFRSGRGNVNQPRIFYSLTACSGSSNLLSER